MKSRRGRPATGRKRSVTFGIPPALHVRATSLLDRGETFAAFATAAIEARCEERETSNGPATGGSKAAI